MDVQEAVAEGATENGEVKRDGRKQFQMGPGDILEGKLIYDGSIHADGRVEGEVRVTGNIDVANGANVKALLEGSNVSLKGAVEGAREATGDIEIAGGGKVNGQVTAYNRLVVGSEASLIASDVRVARLTVEDGATFSGRVLMGPHAEEPAPVAVEEPAPVVEPTPQKGKRR